MSEMNQKTERAHTFSCPSCGGRMVFDPEKQKLRCPYCESEKDIEFDRRKPNEYDIYSAPPADADWGIRTHTVRCQGCGAEMILTEDTSADVCAFCGAPHVMENQEKSGIAPESILPFSIPQTYAAEGFRKWIKKKWFAPSKAKKMAQLGQIMGVYLPHWTYDSNSQSDYVGQAGHYYYVKVPVRVNVNGKIRTEMREERRIEWRPASGRVYEDFDDILIAGSKRLPENLLERVRPFNLGKLVRYDPAFISGFISEKPAVTVKEGWGKAKEVIDERMKDLAKQQILSHADEARITRIITQNENIRYKLTLLPMYLSSFTFKDKQFHVLVNGQTGRVGGQAPVSPLRVCIFIVLLIALMYLLYMLFVGKYFI